MTDAQTEARAIFTGLAVAFGSDAERVEVMRRIATALAAKDAELAAYRQSSVHPDDYEAVKAALAERAGGATHRHKKRGTEYVLIGIGKMQAEDWHTTVLGTDDGGQNAWEKESVDMREVAIYRSATDPAEMWVRPREEFEDGRFEILTTEPAAPAEHRRTFTVPDGYEAILDAKGRATGEVRKLFEPAAPADTETRRGKSREDLHKHEPDHEPDFPAGEQSGETSPGAPEGRQEAVAWMWEDVVDPTGDVIRGGTITRFATHWSTPPSYAVVTPLYTRPAEQAVTDEMVEQLVQATRKYTRETLFVDEHRDLIRSALTSHGIHLMTDVDLAERDDAVLERAAEKARQLLVFADTTSEADAVIPAAIRALGRKA